MTTERRSEHAHRAAVDELEQPASAQDAARVLPDVRRLMSGELGKTLTYLITLRKDGRPHGRPVSTFVEGWTIGTISQGTHLKNQHIRNNAEIAYLWTELCPPDGQRVRSVWLQGRCEIVEDPAEVQAFFARREAALGMGDAHPDDDWVRLLLRTTPTLIRAEGFLGPLRPAIYREFV